MNANKPVSLNGTLPSSEPIDRFLSEFYRSEMPADWPARMSVRPAIAAPATSRSASGSRFALAASVALLIGSCWYLTGSTGEVAGPESRIRMENGDAKLSKEMLEAMKQTPPKMP